jgi:DNA-binding response OmpR family regulator
MKPSKQKILCVDENEDSLELLTITFEQEGFEVITCRTLEECLAQVRRQVFSAIILDNRYGNGRSLAVCREISASAPHTRIIFCSGEARQTEIAKAIEAGGDKYFVKPVDFDILADTVKELIEKNHSVE